MAATGILTLSCWIVVMLIIPPSDEYDRLIHKVLGAKEILLSPDHARVRYQPTGAKRKLQCGWGQTALFEEINV